MTSVTPICWCLRFPAVRVAVVPMSTDNQPQVLLPRPASRHELAILRFPDRHTDWVVILIASLVAPLDIVELRRRLGALHGAVPMVGARLRGEARGGPD